MKNIKGGSGQSFVKASFNIQKNVSENISGLFKKENPLGNESLRQLYHMLYLFQIYMSHIFSRNSSWSQFKHFVKENIVTIILIVTMFFITLEPTPPRPHTETFF